MNAVEMLRHLLLPRVIPVFTPSTRFLQMNVKRSWKDLRKQVYQRAVHYPVPLNKQPALETTEFNLPIAEELSGKVMSLPMHPYLSEDDRERVVEVLAQ